MQWLTRCAMLVLGAISILYVTGCNVGQQVLNTIGLAGQIVGTWVK